MDPIANYLTTIRNAVMVRHASVRVKNSRMNREITRVLKEEGYIVDYKVDDTPPQGTIVIALRYNPKNGNPAIVRLDLVSKQSARRYSKVSEIPNFLNGLGTGVLSTSLGVLSDREARKKRVGGEIICMVY